MQVVRLELEEEVEVGGSDEHPKQDSKASDIFLLLWVLAVGLEEEEEDVIWRR